MKSLCFAALAALFAIGVATNAEAAPSANSFEALAGPAAADAYAPTPYDHCHGRASGTSDAACGNTLTGGPAGGLF